MSNICLECMNMQDIFNYTSLTAQENVSSFAVKSILSVNGLGKLNIGPGLASIVFVMSQFMVVKK